MVLPDPLHGRAKVDIQVSLLPITKQWTRSIDNRQPALGARRQWRRRGDPVLPDPLQAVPKVDIQVTVIADYETV